jgi:hypothetical protein
MGVIEACEQAKTGAARAVSMLVASALDAQGLLS